MNIRTAWSNVLLVMMCWFSCDISICVSRSSRWNESTMRSFKTRTDVLDKDIFDANSFWLISLKTFLMAVLNWFLGPAGWYGCLITGGGSEMETKVTGLTQSITILFPYDYVSSLASRSGLSSFRKFRALQTKKVKKLKNKTEIDCFLNRLFRLLWLQS